LSRVRPFLIGVAAFAVAAFLRVALSTPLGVQYPYIYAYPAIFFAAWLGGAPGGITATVLLALTTQYVVLQPRGGFFAVSATDAVIEVLFVLSGVLISLVAETRLRALERIRQHDAERTRLIAERSAAADRALQSRAWFDALLADVPAVVWEAWGQPDEAAQRINYVSQYVERMLGYRVDEWLAMPNFWLTLVHPDDRERAAREAVAKFESRVGGTSRFRWVRKDGQAIWVEAQSRVICDQNGAPIGMRGVTVDITDAIRMQTDRNELLKRTELARRDAEEANRLKDDFLMTLSHELRTPVHAISGWARLLRSGRLDEGRRQQAIEVIERNAQAQVRLIEDLLDVSRIVSGKLRLTIEEVELRTLVRTVCDTLRPAADAKEITVLPVVDPAVDVIAADPDRLQQAVWNVMSNAVKFTPPGGHVTLRVTRADGDVEFAITDTGQGIDPELLPVIFDRFRQGDSGTTRAFTGLGLGLSLARSLVEAHGGTISAESAGPGRGSVFRIRLPLRTGFANAAAAGSSGMASMAASGRRPLEGQRILAVDDEADSRELLEAMLTDAGATVRTEPSAEAALRVIDELEPTVLLCDIGMPGADGYWLIRQLRAEGMGVRTPLIAVAVTAHVRPEDQLRARAAGFDAHLGKPVDPDELLELLSSLLVPRPSERK
jgi:PAS domain S-box-containing protein